VAFGESGAKGHTRRGLAAALPTRPEGSTPPSMVKSKPQRSQGCDSQAKATPDYSGTQAPPRLGPTCKPLCGVDSRVCQGYCTLLHCNDPIEGNILGMK
jgi:hypothetical protein